MSRTIYDKTGVPITIAETMVIDVDMAINDTLSLVGYGFGGYQDHYEEHKIIFALFSITYFIVFKDSTILLSLVIFPVSL